MRSISKFMYFVIAFIQPALKYQKQIELNWNTSHTLETKAKDIYIYNDNTFSYVS